MTEPTPFTPADPTEGAATCDARADTARTIAGFFRDSPAVADAYLAAADAAAVAAAAYRDAEAARAHAHQLTARATVAWGAAVASAQALSVAGEPVAVVNPETDPARLATFAAALDAARSPADVPAAFAAAVRQVAARVHPAPREDAR